MSDSITYAETSPLLAAEHVSTRRRSPVPSGDPENGQSEDKTAFDTSIFGERLAYNDYTTIDWMRDLVTDSHRHRAIHGKHGVRNKLLAAFDSASGWIAAALIGIITACVAFLVDISVATVSDWKLGYCKSNPFLNRERCCEAIHGKLSNLNALGLQPECHAFHEWSNSYASSYAIYVAFALLFGIVSGSVTLTTKRSLPAASPGVGDSGSLTSSAGSAASGKSMYMAAGSGIPEIKTILSGFVIPNFLDLKVLVVKAVGSVFAVSTGMCLGKEGPFVHISTCVGYLVARLFPKYNHNSRKMREILSAACASGLSVAFGAPIGGVLFSYEEISTYFPRKILWRAFLCSLCAAMTLKELNPTGTGKLVLFETNYGTSYKFRDYLIFVLLGVAGGLWGGIFCRMNYLWSKWFRHFKVIKGYPVFEVFLVVAVTALLQYPNPMIRADGDVVVRNLLERRTDGNLIYIGWLIHGTLTKLILTIITFGIKVPSGVIIPALDAGALFGRLIGQWNMDTISPGIFAMVGAGAFLAGVSRMTISLCVIMFELTGDLEYIVPHMIAILVAKWVADALSSEGVYDLAQTVLGHPFLDLDHASHLLHDHLALAEELIPPQQTMEEITVDIPANNKVNRKMLEEKLDRLKRRGLMDAGLVLVQNGGLLQGYITQAELEYGLGEIGKLYPDSEEVRLLGEAEQEEEFSLTILVDRSALTIPAKAPMEYVVEMFGRLGLRHLMVVEEGTSRLLGVIIKKRLVGYLDQLKEKKEK